MSRIVVIHDGVEILSVQNANDEITVIGHKAFIVDDKATALQIAELLNLSKISLIENFVI